jgi:hypothetical protein
MTLDEYFKREGRGAPTKLSRATGVSIPTLRKMRNRERVREDAAIKVAEFLGCDYKLFSNPTPRRALRKVRAS